MQPWHLTLVARGRHTLFPEPAALTHAIRVLARVCGERLLTFCIVDDHAHVVLNAPSRAAAGYIGSGLSRALLAAGAPRLEPTHVREVEGRGHLESLVGYFARQPLKHGLPGHPALWTGSAVVDLLGARRLPGFDGAALGAALPRLDVVAHVERVCSLPPWAPMAEARLAALSSGTTFAVALAAGAVSPFDRDPHAVAVRAAWASLVERPHPLPARTFRRHRRRPVDPLLRATILRRLGLEAALYSSSATLTIRSASAASS